MKFEALHEAFFSVLISKMSLIFDKKNFVTNFRDEQCFIVQPLSKHVEVTPLGPFNQLYAPSPLSDQNFKMADDGADCIRDLWLVGV